MYVSTLVGLSTYSGTNHNNLISPTIIIQHRALKRIHVELRPIKPTCFAAVTKNITHCCEPRTFLWGEGSDFVPCKLRTKGVYFVNTEPPTNGCLSMFLLPEGDLLGVALV